MGVVVVFITAQKNAKLLTGKSTKMSAKNGGSGTLRIVPSNYLVRCFPNFDHCASINEALPKSQTCSFSIA